MSDKLKFFVTVGVGVVSLIAEFGFDQPKVAFWLILILAAFNVVKSAIEMFHTLQSGKYGIDILAITAIIATFAVGEYWSTWIILLMATGGDFLEEIAEGRASKELRALLDNAPTIAHKIDEDGNVEDLEVDEVHKHDKVLAKAGELVPIDGIVLSGESYVNEASLTGESKPVRKTVNDEILSGTVNGDTALTIEVIRESEDSQYQTIIELVKESQENPAEFVRYTDKLAVPFTIVAYIIAIAAWVMTKDPVRFAQVMVLASPCPLILSAPIALISGMSRASANGVIVRSGNTLEKLSKTTSIAFDKTGTITKGTLAVDEIVPAKDTDVDEKELLRLAASAELGSTHILARSLIEASKEHDLDLMHPEHIEEETGQGIIATINSTDYKLGKAGFAGLSDEDIQNGDLGADKTVVYINRAGEYIGKITFRDQLREEANKTMNKLEEVGVDSITMLTGDKEEVAAKIAEEIGIPDYEAECKPEDKLDFLKAQHENGKTTSMVGDGVNDAPALALADTGIAMGANGASAASETADAVIVDDNLYKVAQLFIISQDTMKVSKQAVIPFLLIFIVLMIVAATGVIPVLVGSIIQEVVDNISMIYALKARKGRSLE